MINSLKLFGIAFVVFSILDALWLGLIATSFYSKEFGDLARRTVDGALSPHWGAAIAAYIVLVLAVVVFILPQFTGKPISPGIFWYGALFGVVVYGVYDLTNLATLKDWSLKVTVLDMLWGGVIYGTTSYVTSLIARYFKLM